MYTMKPMRREDMPLLLEWRQASPQAWRDPVPTTLTRQYEWYDNIVCKQLWFMGLYEDDRFLGHGQIYPIDWINRRGEIGLITSAADKGKGIGEGIFVGILEQGFIGFGLNQLFGECYSSNENIGFWEKMIKRYKGKRVILENTRWWRGKYHNSLYFWFNKNER